MCILQCNIPWCCAKVQIKRTDATIKIELDNYLSHSKRNLENIFFMTALFHNVSINILRKKNYNYKNEVSIPLLID